MKNLTASKIEKKLKVELRPYNGVLNPQVNQL